MGMFCVLFLLLCYKPLVFLNEANQLFLFSIQLNALPNSLLFSPFARSLFLNQSPQKLSIHYILKYPEFLDCSIECSKKPLFLTAQNCKNCCIWTLEMVEMHLYSLSSGILQGDLLKEISKWAGLSRVSLKNVLFEITKFDVLCRFAVYSKYIPGHTTFFLFFKVCSLFGPHGLMG